MADIGEPIRETTWEPLPEVRPLEEPSPQVPIEEPQPA